MSDSLQTLESLVARGRTRIAAREALHEVGHHLRLALIVGMGLVVAAEVGGGLTAQQVPWLSMLLLWPAFFAVRALLQARPMAAVALELDAAAGTQDRLGTALALADQSGALVEAQRRDALSRVGGLSAVELLPLLPPQGRAVWRRSGRAGLALCVLLALGLWTPPRTTDVPPQASEGPSALERAADRLVADLDGLEDALLDRGDVTSLQLLDDLRARVRGIQRRERQREAPPPPREPDTPPPTVEVQPEVTPAMPALLTADDLLRMEAQLAESLVADARNQLGRDLLQSFGDALATNKEAADMMAGMSAEIGQQSLDQALFDGVNALGQTASFNQLMADLNMSDSGNESMNQFSQITQQIEENITANMNRMDVDALPSQEAEHAMQESFQQFLQEFVKEVGEMVARASMGRGSDEPDESNTVRTTGAGNGEQDEDLPMDPQAGFREVENGEGDGDASAAASAGESGGEPSPSQGGPAIAPPEGAGPGQAQAAPPGAAPTAMAEGAEGETSLGAQGAGTGAGPAGGAEGAQTVQQGGARLERLLGQLTEGRLPPEQREQIYDRVGRHNVAGGAASDFEDPMMRDYFSRADALLEESQDVLPPAFRSYIQDYFDALAEGATDAPD